jgi:Holliday junction resolvase RusA-like endonuclease
MVSRSSTWKHHPPISQRYSVRSTFFHRLLSPTSTPQQSSLTHSQRKSATAHPTRNTDNTLFIILPIMSTNKKCTLSTPLPILFKMSPSPPQRQSVMVHTE